MRAKRMRIVAAAALVGGLLASAPAAPAAVTYQYQTPDAPGNALSLSPGQTATLRVYLKETLTGGSTSIVNADGGLFGGGFSLTRTAGTAVTLTGITGASGSGQPFSGGSFTADPSGSTTRRAGDDIVSQTAASGPTPDASGQIFLGQVTITAGSTAGVTTLELANYTFPSKAGGYTQTFGGAPSGGAGFDLDVTRNVAGDSFNYSGAADNPIAISVTVATPEPAGLALLAAGGGAFLLRRRRGGQPAGR